jgi:hypothetical protein
MGIAADAAGVLYVADYGNNRVRQVVPGASPSEATIDAFAGNGVNTRYEGDGGSPRSAGLSLPEDVAVDGATGAVFVADGGHHVIRVVRDEGGATGLVIRTTAGNGTCDLDGDLGPATTASLCNPYGVAADGTGGVYVVDTDNNRIRQAHF